MKRVLVAVVTMGAALRVFIALRPLEYIDRLFFPDDVYYTLSIARSIATGLGPTADGVTLTSGFQPLLAFLQVPIFWLSSNPDVPIRATVVILALCDVAVIALLARLAWRLGGRSAAVAAAAFWAFSSSAIANALGGLETALALAVELALVEVWWWARETEAPRRRTAAFAVTGLVAGLALLARIDAAFLVAALGLLELARRRVGNVLAAAAVAGLVVAPWWIYCWVHFGSPVPESGAAVAQLLELERSAWLTPPVGMGWTAAVLLTPLEGPRAIGMYLQEHPVLAVAVFVAVVGVLVAGGARCRRSPASLGLAVHAVALTAFYGLVLPCPWFLRRYLSAAEAFLCLLVALAAGWLWDRSAGSGRRVALAAVSGTLVVVGAGWSSRWLVAAPELSVESDLGLVKGTRDVAIEAYAMLPPGAVVGAMQTGALSYFKPPGFHVVNLDGVVDGAAREAGRRLDLAEHARQRGVQYFADWVFELNRFWRASAQLPLARLPELVGKTRTQVIHQCMVWRLTWGAPSGISAGEAQWTVP